jgi:hypothetical protein
MKLAVVVNCNDGYVGKGIVALKNFKTHNSGWDMYIIGTKFSQKSHDLATEHGVSLIEVDLSDDFILFNKRPYERQYPIECFYHFYSHVCLSDYDYIVTTEPDIYFNRKIEIKMLRSVRYIGVSYHKSHFSSRYKPIVKDMDKFETAFGKCKVRGYRPLGGVRIYNVSGLNRINFYRMIVDTYQKCWEIGRPICGDDGTFHLFKIFNPQYITDVSTDLMIIYHNFKLNHVNKVYSFHFGGPNKKYWDKRPAKTDVEEYFRNKMIEFVKKNFTLEFIKEHLPTLEDSS